jgi:mRNA interferase MazF
VLADASRGDWVCCQITSNPYGDPLALPLGASDFAVGLLRVDSVMRPGKFFTADHSLFAREVGRLNPAAIDRLLLTVTTLLRP